MRFASRHQGKHTGRSGKGYRELVQNQGEGVGIVDAEERFTFSNPAGEEIFGVAPGRLMGRTLKEFTTAEQYARVLEQTKLRSEGRRSTYELEIIRARSSCWTTA